MSSSFTITMENLSSWDDQRGTKCRGLGLDLLLLLLMPVFAVVTAQAESECHLHITQQRCSVRDPSMDPTYEVQYGHDVVWQIPPNPKGILFLAHGGYKDPLSFFDRGPKCEPCYGLPEDRAVALEALHRGYAVIAIKSSGTGYDIFPIETSTDLVIVPSIINKWTMEYSLDNLPLFAWGHSAGGYFVSALPLKLHIRALVLMCSCGLREIEETAIPGQYPSTFFAYMPIDEDNTGKSLTAMAILSERGVEVAEKQCWPKPLSPLFFTERIRCLSNETSREIYRAYKADRWLDSNDYLTKNPASNDWEAVLWKAKAVLPYCEEFRRLCLAPHILQELQMAYAEHSLTSEANEKIFPWMESKMLSLTEHTASYSRLQ